MKEHGDVLGGVPGIQDTKRQFEVEGGVMHLKEHGGHLVSKTLRDSLR